MCQEQVEIRNLHNNPGLLPVSLGSAFVEKYHHKMIHYYDFSLLVTHLDTLSMQYTGLKLSVLNDSYYTSHFANHIKIIDNIKNDIYERFNVLNFSKSRNKRGLINALESIFKSITGNLDYEDGDRFESIIKQLEKKQNTLNKNINKEYSLSIEIINNFNKTLQDLYFNQHTITARLLEAASTIKQKIVAIINIHNIAMTLNEIHFIYEEAQKVLDRLHNAITFTRLKILHPSVINTKDLFNSLTKLQKILSTENLHFEVSYENLNSFIKLMTTDCYIYNSKITFILNIPLFNQIKFNLYKLYAIPTWLELNTLQVMLPDSVRLTPDMCYCSKIITPDKLLVNRTHFCKTTIMENKNQKLCTANVIIHHNLEDCIYHKLEMIENQLMQIDETQFWLLMVPTETDFKVNCPTIQEIHNLQGSFLIRLTDRCTVTMGSEIIGAITIESYYQPIIYEFRKPPRETAIKSLNLKLKFINLKDLSI